jgi:filamentous hemagglutinin family protein
MLCQTLIKFWGLRLLYLGFPWYLFTATPVKAQIIPDQTLPENSRITSQDTLIHIEGGTRIDNNLFHSFEQFSVPANFTANFDNNLQIQNIFSRVTGASISEIHGTIQALGTANLFLINPNGILFGENASLNIGGSFFATTADSILFADGSQFSATDPLAPPLLTVNIPIGLWFREHPGAIINRSGTTVTTFDEESEKNTQTLRGGLAVASGQTLGLVGSDVILDEGFLEAENGRVELGSVGENSVVALNLVNHHFELDYQNVLDFQQIQIINGSQINTTGEGGGDLQIQGGQVILSDYSIIDSSTLGDQPGGTIEITAQESIDIVTSRIRSHVGSKEYTQASGDGGDIRFTTRRLSVSTGAIVSVSTYGLGNGGDLMIQATDVEVVGRDLTDPEDIERSSLLAQVFEQGTGNPQDRRGGNILINTERLSIRDQPNFDPSIPQPPGISVTSFRPGNAGDIHIDASDYLEVIDGVIQADIALYSIGNGGDITIHTGRLLLAEGSFIATTILGQGNAGNITITATDIEISNPSGVRRGGILAQVNREGRGSAGSILINTERLTIRDGEFISVSSENLGNAGTLRINAMEVELIGQSSPATRTENLGASELQVGLFLKGENEEFISNRLGGNLILNTEQLILRDGAQISGLTVGNGDGGNLNITASEISLHNNSGITARAAQDSSGGNIAINTGSLILQESNITADAEIGRGGNIAIQTELLFRDPNSLISATSALGIDGTVTLNIPEINPSSGLIEVPETPIDVTHLIGQDPCSQPHNSELINTGRGGLPPSPQESLRSEETFVELIELNFEEHSAVPLDRQQNKETTTHQPLSSLEIVPARGWIRNENGDVILVSYDPTQTGVQRQRQSVSQCQF